MALNESAITTCYNAVLSHVAAAYPWDSVLGHEPKSNPVVRPDGPVVACWADFLGPATGSGLASTSALLVVMARAYMSAMVSSYAEADRMDPKILSAVSAIIGRLAGDLDLGGNARVIDIRGMSGRRLQARAGYVEQDRKVARVLVLEIPIIINDAWVEVP